MRNLKWQHLLYGLFILSITAYILFLHPQLQDTQKQSDSASQQHNNKAASDSRQQKQPATPPPPTELHLMAVGDIMMHEPQITAGKTATGYDFASFFEHIAPTLKQADFAFGNLETTLAGEAARYAGYPMFNAPDELADALKAAHFDVITTANNHSLDRWEKGLYRTLEQLDRVGLLHTGTFASKEARDQPLIISKDDIKLGVLAYTYGTNGMPIPEGRPYVINMLDESLMAKDIQTAKAAGVDMVVVAVHFGPEYWRKPSAEQKRTVDFLFNAGADIILGSHPHVIQPYEVRDITNLDGSTRKGVVIYSLGNFISNQRDEPRDIGGILSVKINKQNGTATIGDVSFIATYIHRYQTANGRVYNVLPIAEVIEKRNYPPFRPADYSKLEARYQEMMEHVISEP